MTGHSAEFSTNPCAGMRLRGQWIVFPYRLVAAERSEAALFNRNPRARSAEMHPLRRRIHRSDAPRVRLRGQWMYFPVSFGCGRAKRGWLFNQAFENVIRLCENVHNDLESWPRVHREPRKAGTRGDPGLRNRTP